MFENSTFDMLFSKFFIHKYLLIQTRLVLDQNWDKEMNRTGRGPVKSKCYHWALFKYKKIKPQRYLRNLPSILKQGANEAEC